METKFEANNRARMQTPSIACLLTVILWVSSANMVKLSAFLCWADVRKLAAYKGRHYNNSRHQQIWLDLSFENARQIWPEKVDSLQLKTGLCNGCSCNFQLWYVQNTTSVTWTYLTVCSMAYLIQNMLFRKHLPTIFIIRWHYQVAWCQWLTSLLYLSAFIRYAIQEQN